MEERSLLSQDDNVTPLRLRQVENTQVVNKYTGQELRRSVIKLEITQIKLTAGW